MRLWISHVVDPREAKRRGRQVTLRPEWDAHHRYTVMRQVLRAKFTDPGLRTRLINTGTALLIESNTWCDRHWGSCVCRRHRAVPGHNHLGRTLMDLRDQLTEAPATRWTRVACTGPRPQNLPPDSYEWVVSELRRVATKLVTHHDTQIAISGGAAGTDLWWADAAQHAGTRLWLYQPFPQQTERWPQEWRDHHERVRRAASRVAVLGQRYSPKTLYDRNFWMLRDAQALVCVNDPERHSGGTHHTLQHALRRNMPVIHIDVRIRETRLRLPQAA